MKIDVEHLIREEQRIGKAVYFTWEMDDYLRSGIEPGGKKKRVVKRAGVTRITNAGASKVEGIQINMDKFQKDLDKISKLISAGDGIMVLRNNPRKENHPSAPDKVVTFTTLRLRGLWVAVDYEVFYAERGSPFRAGVIIEGPLNLQPL